MKNHWLAAVDGWVTNVCVDCVCEVEMAIKEAVVHQNTHKATYNSSK